MHRSWSKRHARPAAASSAQEQENPHPHPHPHHRLRHKTSLTQRLLGCSNKSVTAVEPLLPTVEEKARPRTFYVPTHAAASFARTVSPRSPIRIDDDDRHELADGQDDDDDGSGSGREKCHERDSSNRESQHTATSTSNYTHSPSTKAAASSSSSSCHQPDAPSTDYAAFLAQAEVNERAARARMAAPPRSRESGREWLCQSNGSTATATAAGAAALRDSAYYSTGSRRSSSSRSRGRGRGRGEGVGVGVGVGEDTVAPLLARRQPRTLGRRLSEYFKPPRREEGCLGEMG